MTNRKEKYYTMIAADSAYNEEFIKTEDIKNNT